MTFSIHAIMAANKTQFSCLLFFNYVSISHQKQTHVENFENCYAYKNLDDTQPPLNPSNHKPKDKKEKNSQEKTKIAFKTKC